MSDPNTRVLLVTTIHKPDYNEALERKGLKDSAGLQAASQLIAAVSQMGTTGLPFSQSYDLEELPKALQKMHRYLVGGRSHCNHILQLLGRSSQLEIHLASDQDDNILITFKFMSGHQELGDFEARCDLATGICSPVSIRDLCIPEL